MSGPLESLLRGTRAIVVVIIIIVVFVVVVIIIVILFSIRVTAERDTSSCLVHGDWWLIMGGLHGHTLQCLMPDVEASDVARHALVKAPNSVA